MGSPSYMRSVVDRNVVMRRVPVVILTLVYIFQLPQTTRTKLPSFLFLYIFIPLFLSLFLFTNFGVLPTKLKQNSAPHSDVDVA